MSPPVFSRWCRQLTLCLLLAVRSVAQESADPAPAPPNYTDQVKVLELDRDRAVAELRAAYRAELTRRIEDLSAHGDEDKARAFGAEKARLEAGRPLTESDGSITAPLDVLAVRLPYIEKVHAATAAAGERIDDARRRRIAALRSTLATAGPDSKAAIEAVIEQEEARLPSGSAGTSRSTRRTESLGGDGGTPFEDFGPRDSLLTGLRLCTAPFGDNVVLCAVQPLFISRAGPKEGVMHGHARKNVITLAANPGYAVGAVNVRAGDRVDALQLIFMRIRPDGAGLDPDDAYESDWVGGEGGEPGKLGSGRALAGIAGASGVELDSISLIEIVPPPDSDAGASNSPER